MGFFNCIFLIFYVITAFLLTLTHGTCQCNQMIHPGVFSGERMTFSAEENHNRDKRSENGGRQPFTMGAISFEPPYLDFGEQPIGMPYVRDVVVLNPSTEKNLQLQTLSGDNAHFHASFGQPKALSPLTNTTFEVIFLARNLGNVENTLFIHTSSGAYPYQVRGFGIQNPYRLRPFLGTKIALEHSFSSVINMYNPHESMLQITEIYSSGGDLHLELPTGEDDASHKHWQIAPYETKAIIKLSFLGRVASNHTSFIRIRTDKFIGPNQFIILPVEVEVSAVPGIFAAIDQMDFGTLRRMDEPKTIVVSLMNTGSKPVSLTDVNTDPPNKAVTIDIKSSVIKHSHQYIKAFTVTYSASNVKSPKQHFGKIVIKSTSKNTPRLEINYHVNVLQGTLAYSVSKTRFYIGLPPYEPVVREIVITNTFTFPLVIYRVVVSADVQESFTIVNFSSPITVQEQKTVTPFSIRFLANKSMSTFSSSIRVYTNASIFTIPINCYDGKLQFLHAESVLDFGILAVTQKHHKMFQIVNPNPVEVTIKKVTSNASLAKLIRINENSVDDQAVVEDSEEFTVKPGRQVKFSLDITVPHVEGEYTGNVSFNTPYETKTIVFSLEAARGRIEVDPVKIVFSPSFPGQIQKLPLFLKSTFMNSVNVTSAVVKTEDKHFAFVPIKKSNAQLAPHNRQKIGDVLFDPGLMCQLRCYLGIKDKVWFESLSLPSDTAVTDISFLETSQAEWNSITETGKNNFSSSLVIDTEAVKGVKATIEGGLVWPSLTSDRPVRFPLTHVGNVSRKTLMLFNPADVPVVIQIVPLSVYPDAQSVFDVLSDRFDVDLFTAKPSYHSCFSLPTALGSRTRKLGNLALQEYLRQYGKLATENKPAPKKFTSDVSSSLESKLGVRTSPNTISLIIGPRSKAKVPVQFKPENENQRTSVMFIRNNLTVLDIVTVQGQGARGELMINGKRPSVDSVLLFELKQRHLADCTKVSSGSGGKPYRALTVKKTVLATNPGQLATQVTSFSIDGYECEGYGFKVLNCHSLNLKPTASVKIDITFTPDFSVSRVSRRLQIKTALGTVFEFSLIATIPSELIPLCAAAAGRPAWEFHVYVSAIAVMICLLMGVLVLAHFEANKLVSVSLSSLNPNPTLLNGSTMNGELFDLRKITAPGQVSSIPDIREDSSHDKDVSGNTRRPRKDFFPDKMKANPSLQVHKPNSNDCSESLVSNNNSINETPECDRTRDKMKSNDGIQKDIAKKQRKNNSVNQPPKRKDSDSDIPKPIVVSRPVITHQAIADEVVHPVVSDTSLVSGTNFPETARDSSSSEANSVCSDVINTLPVKKEKSKIRKKTSKVAPAVLSVEEKKTNAVDKAKTIEKEKTKDKTKGKETNSSLGKVKDKRIKNGVEIREENKEVRKSEASPKSPKSQNDKTSKSRRTSLPAELENTNNKTKDDKAKANQSLTANPTGKNQGHSGKSISGGSNKKTRVSHSNSLPATRSRKQMSDPAECPNSDPTPHISEVINSALKLASLRVAPTGDPSNQKRPSRSQSRCSSLSPSPPLSDSSQDLSRSSSYSSVVGSEESGSSENSSKHKKHHSKAQKPSPLTIPMNNDLSGVVAVKSIPNNAVCDDLPSHPWRPGLWDCSPCDAERNPTVDHFPSVSTSSSLFASTPFDKDGKLENRTSSFDTPYSDQRSMSADKHPLYTFHDVKAPGLSTPFVEAADTSVPTFWSDDPIPSLDSLISNFKQRRNTNWVNFLDESSTGTSNLPSPGMPQSTKTVAEIWDAGQSHDGNDGWSVAFSPAFDSDLSPTNFPSFHQPYESSWSTDVYPNDYYGVTNEHTWRAANQSPETDYPHIGHENSQHSGTHQLNPYCKPWEASGAANKSRWSSAFDV